MFTKTLKKAALATAAVCTIGGAAFAATPQQTYVDAVNTMSTHPEGTYTTQVKMVMPFVGDVTGHQQAFIQLEPEAKARFDTWATSSQGRDSEKVSGYMEQDGARFVVYYPQTERNKNKSAKTVWKKASIPLKDSRPLVEVIRQEQHKGVLNGVKSVTALGGDRYNVVYDMSRIYKNGDEKEWEKQGLTKAEDRELLKTVLLALKDSGDVSAQLTIDPRSHRVTHVSVPLTAQMRSVASVIADKAADYAPDKKAELAMAKQFAMNSTVSFDCDWSLLPQGIDLSVPESVKKQAVEDKDGNVLVLQVGDQK